jgi:hypothetical protein
VALLDAELALISKGQAFLAERAGYDERMLSYYEGRQRLLHMGLAVPPDLQDLELVLNMARVVVDTIEERQDVKNVAVVDRPDVEKRLRVIMDANNLDSELCLWKRDRLVYGRGFLSVGRNDDADGQPIIQVESPREMVVRIDRRHRRVEAAVRLSEKNEIGVHQRATIYLPDVTVWADRVRGEWVEEDRDAHRMGRVQVIPSFNRRMTGEWAGHSEMEDVIPIEDASIRTLTDLQAAVEVAAIPKNIIAGAKRSDFGDNLEGWFNYLQPLLTLSDSQARAYQLSAADLKNFHETVELYGKLASTVTGFPARYFGLVTTNPPAEGAIRAEESKLVKRVERVNAECGTALSDALALAAAFAGEDVSAGLVNVQWHDPATPTFSQKADALQKLAGGKPLISREGAWDELGWDPARKDAERAYFAAEESDPQLDKLTERMMPSGGGD